MDLYKYKILLIDSNDEMQEREITFSLAPFTIGKAIDQAIAFAEDEGFTIVQVISYTNARII